MKKISISACLLLGMIVNANAETVSSDVALTAARNFYASQTGSLAPQLQLAGTYKTEKGDIPTLYVFENQAGNGFVIVSAENHVQPILGYSTESKFYAVDGRNSPEAAYWLNTYTQQIEYVIDNNIAATAKVTAQWNSWLQSQTRPTPPTVPVAPLLTTLWDQMPLYNYYCPTGTPTGCVATAMAQIMKFWNYPAQGTGQHSYSTSSVGGTLSANFGATTYNWSSMPGQLTQTSQSAQKAAVGTLMSHCGISVDMDYNTTASGAQVILGNASAKNAFTNYFGYKSSIKGYKREDFVSDFTWHSMLLFEIRTGRPLLYAGFGTVGGHAFVFDGYDANEMFHINWGWGGSSNGYFIVDNLNPSALGTGGGSGNFNFNQQVIVMIEPPSSTLATNPWNKNATSISQVDINNKFLLYPNPATNTINFDAENYSGKITEYVIYNTLGQTQMTNKTTANKFSINTSTLSTGLYYIQLNTTDGLITKPVSITR
ncbi:hypothetical protein DBR32_03615 [Taibaiella sp. KBW10]|uniref:thiol protease/hemagglutinin PrtT n=1 Tax=Taibaiella sp. KBW10 TaxID=2153357 RepID=UPI000F5AEB53|nr:thiol protease/hemagglutinin PrtT [Taibaiella sp. KBW10]RQO31905.1 hypothetical protein DBR32_03615 [Taibaiella sp. KBW10]